MVHVLIDDWVYMDINGQPGAYGREEAQRDFKGKIKSISAAFIDCETKIIAVPSEQGAQRSSMVASAFSDEYLIQEERVSPGIFQVIATRKEVVESAYHYFKPTKIESLVPYPVGIRALLNSRSFLGDGKVVIFVDDLKTQAIVTIFEGMRFTMPRRISMRDLGYMTTEIKRSRQSYLGQRSIEMDFIVVSNNSQWLNYFVEQGLCQIDDIRCIDSVFPVLEGLKIAQFGMHFSLPSDVIRQKRAAVIRRHVINVGALLLVIILSLSVYVFIRFRNDQLKKEALDRATEQRIAKERLADLNKRKILQVFKKRKPIALEEIYFKFISNVPLNHLVKSFNIVKVSEQHWKFTAIVFPSNEDVLPLLFSSDYGLESLLIEDVVVGDSLAQKIELDMGSDDVAIDKESLPDDPIKPVDYYYRGLYEDLQTLGRVASLKRSIAVQGLDEKGGILSAIRASDWEGIRKIDLDVRFFDVKGMDQYLLVLQAISQVNSKYPSSVITVDQHGNELKVGIELYGT